jgi:hypothetical protein
MVATSDYDDFHKLVKRCIITNLLGAGAQVCGLSMILYPTSCIEEMVYWLFVQLSTNGSNAVCMYISALATAFEEMTILAYLSGFHAVMIMHQFLGGADCKSCSQSLLKK